MKYIFFTLFAAFIVSCANGQPTQQTSEAEQGNLRIDNNRLYAKILIGGSDTLDLFFDTGSMPGMILPDSIAYKYIDQSKLSNSAYFGNSKRQMKTESNDLYSGLPIMLDSTEIEMAIISVSNSEAMMFGLGNRNGYRYWSVDYDRMMLSILADSTRVDTVGAMVWGFEPVLSQVILNIPMTIYCGGKSLTVNHKWLLDTGTPYSMLITNPDSRISDFVGKIPHIKIYDHGTEFFDNKRLQYKFYLDSIAFGDAGSLTKHSGVVVDEGWHDMMQQFGCMGTIGMDLLKHYNMIIDFKQNRIILRPHGKEFDFYSPLIDSGLGFHLQPNGMVSQIEVGHNAQKAGLRLDDVIVKVNGEGFNNRDELRKAPSGTPLTLTVKRGEEIREINYTASKTLSKN